MSETRTEERLGKLETEFAIVKNDVTAIGHGLNEFREDWGKKAEADQTATHAALLTFPQVVAMIGTAVVVTDASLEGLLYLVNAKSRQRAPISRPRSKRPGNQARPSPPRSALQCEDRAIASQRRTLRIRRCSASKRLGVPFTTSACLRKGFYFLRPIASCPASSTENTNSTPPSAQSYAQ